MHPAFARVDHRPWPLPAGAWTSRQTWSDLLFAHWPIPVSVVRALIPPALEVDEYDGTTWVGLVPFRMSGVMLRGLPDLPGISAFPELNLRLYVRHRDRPGVWFVSLDATKSFAVWGARRFFDLPYFRAVITVERAGERLAYHARRLTDPAVELRGTYGPTGPSYEARPGTLEHFLTERYCLYAVDRSGALRRVQIHHVPWPLQPAEAALELNTVASAQGLDVRGPPALLHFARRLDVVIYPRERL